MRDSTEVKKANDQSKRLGNCAKNSQTRIDSEVYSKVEESVCNLGPISGKYNM